MAKQNKKPSQPPKEKTPKKKKQPKKKGKQPATTMQLITQQPLTASSGITVLASIDVLTVTWNNNPPTPLSANVSAHVVLNPATEMFNKATLTCKDNTSGVSVGAPTPMTWTPATSTALAPNAFPGLFVSGHSYKFTVVVEYRVLQQTSAAADKQAP